ncbi:MAG: cytochrome c3 family protein [Terriglobales bacterium]
MAEMKIARRRWRAGLGFVAAMLLGAIGSVRMAERPVRAADAPGAECLACHGDRSSAPTREGSKVPLFVDGKKFATSVHASFGCTGCHADLEGKDFPHDKPAPVKCGTCHSNEQELYVKSLHGKAVARGDPLAPRCVNCHGNHEIFAVKDKRSAVAPLKVPFVCGQCHREGTPVSLNRQIGQDNILGNYSESIHGEALLKKGLSVAPTCATCHTAHSILPHTDPASSINRKNIANTCTQCHSQIETVHRKIIRGELWEKQANVLPSCPDCHQPHKIRNVFYEMGMANADCMRCHADEKLRRARDGKSMFVNMEEVSHSVHSKKGVACSQCHSEVNASRVRPCETITKGVDCTSCHDEVGKLYATSIHGQLNGKSDPNAPTCKECHGTHGILNKQDPQSATFAVNVPNLCGRCHREGQKAAVRYTGTQHEIITNYTESIHGTLLKNGLTVTATCTSCHTAHHILPRTDAASSVNANNVPNTCGQCHHGIEEQFENSIHSKKVSGYDKALPVCNDCHTAHSIHRTDENSFRLSVMTTCGRCHEKIAETYFETYHGKVSRLGYTKAAKCYDCHGAHDVLRVSDPRSHLSRANVAATCAKCHAGATRRFAGYLTHATHHDPKKYPFVFYTFWGMTGLLLGTFVVGGVHTLLWLPKAFQMRRELKAAEEKAAAETEKSPNKEGNDA